MSLMRRIQQMCIRLIIVEEVMIEATIILEVGDRFTPEISQVQTCPSTTYTRDRLLRRSHSRFKYES